MNRMTILALGIILVSGLVGSSPFILDQTSLNYHEEKFNTSVNVINVSGNETSLGINADQNLNFGNIPQGSNATKFVNMSTGKKSLLTLKSEGNISDFIEHKDHFYFQGQKQIPLEVKGKSPGNFTGNVSLKFEIPQNQVGKHWLDLKYRIYRTL